MAGRSHGVHFLAEPANTSVRLHSSATLRCAVASNNTAALLAWSRVDSNGARSQIALAQHVVKTWANKAKAHNASLLLLNVTRELAGRYECSVPLLGLSRSAELVVVGE